MSTIFNGNASAGPYFRETDRSQLVSSPAIGRTVTGLVGETTKGPAFEPIFIGNFNEFQLRFGGLNPERFPNSGIPKYQLPYVASEYLKESNALYVTRVLGLSGYLDVAGSWIITSKGGVKRDTLSLAGLGAASVVTASTAIYGTSGQTTTGFPGNYIEDASSITDTISGFQATGKTYNVFSIGPTGYTYLATATTVNYNRFEEYHNMVLGVLRSTGSYISNTLIQPVTGITLSGASRDGFDDFLLTTSTNTGTNVYNVNLNINSKDYIGRALSKDALDSKADIWLDEIYPQLIRKLVSEDKIFGINQTLFKPTSDNIDKYNVQFQTPISPYVVSELRGGKIYRLFKVFSISDGTSANREIKISIENIDLDTREFDLAVRNFGDTDSSVSKLETYTKLNFDPASPNYILKRIGDAGDQYGINSKYIFIQLAENVPVDAVPAGFEGYSVKNYGDSSGIKGPVMQYKTQYDFVTEKVNKTYLGISEKAFSTTDIAGDGLDADRFDYNSETLTKMLPSSGITHGFHMDVRVSGISESNRFVTTPYLFGNELELIGTDLESKKARKFTFLLAGGFDGWDIYRKDKTYNDRFQRGRTLYNSAFPTFTSGQLGEMTSDWYAFEKAIRTFNFPEQTPINVFATPGIDFENNTALVEEVIDMIETERPDCLYIIDAPDKPRENYAEAIADALDISGLDTSYAATYGPWVQYVDNVNGVNIYLPPTYEVLRNIAFTDNRQFPWFAIAGSTRGNCVAIRARKALTQSDRDTMAEARVNPIATFPGDPIQIFGQSTLQSAPSLLQGINIRRLLLEAQRIILRAVRVILFEPNDAEFEQQFLDIVNPILLNIRENRGLYRFQVVTAGLNTPETRGRREFYANIELYPIPAVEKIIIGFNINTEGSFSFQEVQQ